MAEPVSAVLALVGTALTSWKVINNATQKYQNVDDTIRHWSLAVEYLRSLFQVLQGRLQSGHELPDEQKECYKNMAKHFRVLNDDLDEIKKKLPNEDRKSSLFARLKGSKTLFALTDLDKDLVRKVDRNIGLLQVSLSVIQLLERQAPITCDYVMSSLARFVSDKGIDDHQEFDSWKISADKAIRQWVRRQLRRQLDQERQEQLAARQVNSPIPTDDAISMQQASIERPRMSSICTTSDERTLAGDEFDIGELSIDELQHRYQVAQEFSNRLVEANCRIVASEYKLKAIDIQKRLRNLGFVPFRLIQYVELEESYIDLLLSCSRWDRSFLTRASERLDALTSIPSLNPEESSHKWYYWWKLGVLYSKLDEYSPINTNSNEHLIRACRFLRLALDVCTSQSITSQGYELGRIVELLYNVYERLDQMDASEALRRLLNARLGFDPTLEREELQNALSWCQKNGYQATELNGSLNFKENFKDGEGTPLHAAALDSHMEPTVISRLVSEATSKGFLFYKDKSGSTALHLAVEKPNRIVFEKLMAHPSLMGVLDTQNKTPLHRCRDARIMEVLLSTRQRSTSLTSQYTTASSQDLGHIHVDFKDGYGRTALHYACKLGRRDLVEVLITHNADVNACSDSEQTPLVFMCLQEMERLVRDSIVILLLSKGANAKVRDKDGNDVEKIFVKQQGYSKSEARRLLHQHDD